MEEEKLKYSFIILFYHSEELARSFLESLALQLKKLNPDQAQLLAVFPEKNKFIEKIVAEVFRKNNVDIQIKTIPLKDFKKVKAWNKGIESAEGRFLIFSVDDVLLHHRYVTTFEEEVERMSQPVVGGGRIIPFFDREKPAWLAKWLLPLLEEINLGEEIKPFPKKKHPLGQNMFASKEIFDQYGNFEEKNDMSAKIALESFFSKLRQQNVPVFYFPNLMVWHFIPEEKLDRSYLRKMAEEKILLDKQQARQKGFKYIFRLKLMELWKWIVTFLMAVYYFLTGQWSKIKSVFQYRYWHTKTLFSD